MATTTLNYSTSQSINIGLSGLSSSLSSQSDAIDNTTTKYLDTMVTVNCVLNGTPGIDKAVYVWAYGSEDGITFTDNATGISSWSVPNGITSVDYLVVGGGGAGAGTIANNGIAGAGGAGGYRTATGLAVTPGTPITVTVGVRHNGV